MHFTILNPPPDPLEGGFDPHDELMIVPPTIHITPLYNVLKLYNACEGTWERRTACSVMKIDVVVFPKSRRLWATTHFKIDDGAPLTIRDGEGVAEGFGWGVAGMVEDTLFMISIYRAYDLLPNGIEEVFQLLKLPHVESKRTILTIAGCRCA